MKSSRIFLLIWIAFFLVLSSTSGQIEAATLRLDSNFTPAFSDTFPGDFTYINDIQEQKDGKILVAGWFNIVNGQSLNGIARLLGDGSLDPDFDPGSGIEDVELKGLAVTPALVQLNRCL